MKVALVHDDLVQWGGAERVLAALAEMFPGAPIYTAVYDSANTLIDQHFSGSRVHASFIQKIPGWRSFYKALLPIYPLAMENFDFSGFDLVISQTTRFAKSIITQPGTRHICYCHTPPRFLWNFSGEKVQKALTGYFGFLRIYDQITSNRVDQWIAGSRNAQQRLKKVYGVDSEVIYPFVDLTRFKDIKTFSGGYLLIISRLNDYKRVDLAIKVANKLRRSLKIVGVGPAESNLRQIAGPMVEFVGLVREDILLRLLAGCEALLVTAEEDFGLTALEAQAMGKPVIAFGQGGSLETVIEGETGYLFQEQNPEAVEEALAKLDKKGYNQERCLRQAQRFSKTQFTRQFQRLFASQLAMKS